MIEWRMNKRQSTALPPQWTDWRMMNFYNVTMADIIKAKDTRTGYVYEYRTDGKYFTCITDDLFQLMEKEIMWKQLHT